jgi:hypothetical protein
MLVVVAVAGTQIVQPLVEALEVVVIAALLPLSLHLEPHLLAVVVVVVFLVAHQQTATALTAALAL